MLSEQQLKHAIQTKNVEMTMRGYNESDNIHKRFLMNWACRTSLDNVLFLQSLGIDMLTDNNHWSAVNQGNLPVVKYFCENRTDVDYTFLIYECTTQADPRLKILKYFVEELHKEIPYDKVKWEAIRGNLEAVKYCIENTVYDTSTGRKKILKDALDMASERLRYEVVRYIHEEHGIRIPKNNLKIRTYMNIWRRTRERALSVIRKFYVTYLLPIKRNKAQKKIYFWILPKLYKPGSESAKRLALSSWNETSQFMETHLNTSSSNTSI